MRVRLIVVLFVLFATVALRWNFTPATAQDTDSARITVLETQVADLTQRVKLLEAQTTPEPLCRGPIMGTPAATPMP